MCCRFGTTNPFHLQGYGNPREQITPKVNQIFFLGMGTVSITCFFKDPGRFGNELFLFSGIEATNILHPLD
jgi:hypothetical protein